MSAKISVSGVSLASPEGSHLNTEHARLGSASVRRLKHILLGNVCVLALGLAMTMGPTPAAAAKYLLKRGPAHKQAEQASKLPFGEIPKGPYQIFISLNEQKLHFYSDGTHVTDALVATGVPGHPTPMGVFSVIEKDRYHHSNIYSGAPMPFMQRITWSGVALHEGPGVGHVASHGCIRMPHDFAARLWVLPTMGMRVIIARQELRPEDFADPRLFVHKDKPPTSAAVLAPAVQTAQKVDPGIRTDVLDAPVGAPPETHQATPAAAAAPTGRAQPTLAEIVKGAAADATQLKKPAPAASSAAPAPSAAAAVATAAAPTLPPPAQLPNTAATGAAAPTSPQSMPSAATAAPAVPSQAANVTTASTNLTAPISLDDVPLPLSKPSRIAGGASGPIAIFVSRKESKIYVRQDFTPLFDAPVKIENPNQPFGTHVFTALNYLPDHTTFRWNVVSLPGAAAKPPEKWKYVRDAYGRRLRVRVNERAAEPVQDSTPETPQQALARIEIPQDVIDQISHLIVPGSSFVISDQGLGSETGDHTDFIVVTR